MHKALTVIKTLQKKKVKFLVIGGTASVIYGVQRATFDIDILLPPDVKTISRFVTVLRGLGYKEVFDIRNDHLVFLGRIEVVNSETVIKFQSVKFKDSIDVDLLVAPSKRFFDFVWGYRVKVKFEGVTIPVPSIVDLIRMKEQSGREKDLGDVRELRHILRGLKKRV